MNFNFYIFGNSGEHYNQYPQDYTADMIMPLCENLAGSRAVIYRHMDLMHYVFVESLDNGRYFGLCLIFNKVRARYPKNLIDYMRGVIENHALKNRKILEYTDAGDIIFVKPQLCQDVKAYDYLKSIINATLDGKNNFGIEELKTIYDGVDKTGYVDFKETGNAIVKLTDEYNRVVIEDSEGIEKNHTHRVIASLKEELAARDTAIADLNNDISALEKQKKQYRKVMFLLGVLVCCCGGLYFLYDSLNQTERKLRDTAYELAVANDTIESNRLDIARLNARVSSLSSSLASERRQKEDLQERLDDMLRSAPFVVTGSSFSFASRYYECKYYASESGEKSITVKVISNSSGNVVMSRTMQLSLQEGYGNFSVYVNRSLDSSRWYTFEIWYGNRLLGGSQH